MLQYILFLAFSLPKLLGPLYPQGTGRQWTLGSVLLMVLGGGVASSAAIFLGLGPIGAVASGVVGIVGTEIFNNSRRTKVPKGDYEHYGRDLILHAIREANLQVQEHIQGNRQTIRQVLKTELDTIESLLDQALRVSRSPLSIDNPFSVERERLQEYRRMLAAKSGNN